MSHDVFALGGGCFIGHSGAAVEREGRSWMLRLGRAVACEQCRSWYGLPVTSLRGSTAVVATLAW